MIFRANPKGYGAPFVRVFTTLIKRGVNITFDFKSPHEVTDNIDYFSYKHSEEADDYAQIVIKSQDVTLPDKPEYQENIGWTIIWGYMPTPENPQGLVSAPRKVYIREIEPDYNSDGLTLTIKAYDKASYLKSTSRKAVYSGKDGVTVGDVAKTLADVNGLDLEGSFPTKGNLQVDTYAITAGDEKFANWYRMNWAKNNPKAAQDRTLNNLYIPGLFKVNEELIQGNQSDWNMLKRQLDKEKNGPFVLEGRDDKLIIKKRNLGKAPIKAYEWKGEDGELLKFRPETKNRSNKAASTQVTVGTFDPEQKIYYEGSASEVTDDNPRLGDVVDANPYDASDFQSVEEYDAQVNRYKLHQLTNKILEANGEKDFKTMAVHKIEIENPDTKEKSVFYEVVGASNLNDQVAKDPPLTDILHGKTAFTTSARSSTSVVITKGAILTQKDYIEGMKSPDNSDALAQANNRRHNAALEMNPGTFTAIGHPHILSGEILTFKKLAKKYSGNYYVTEMEHIITNAGGYLMNGQIKRNATSKTGNEPLNKVDVKKDLGKTVNQEASPTQEGEAQPEKTIPIIKTEEPKEERDIISLVIRQNK